MKLILKNGIIAGLAGLAVGGCFSLTIAPFCGPLVAILVGALAGHFTGRESGLADGRQRGWRGTLAGAIAGTFVLLANVLIGLSRTGEFADRAHRDVPTGMASQADQALFVTVAVAAAVGVQLLLGLADVLAAMLVGAVTSYWARPLVAGTSVSVPGASDTSTQSSIWSLSLMFGLVIAGLAALAPIAISGCMAASLLANSS